LKTFTHQITLKGITIGLSQIKRSLFSKQNIPLKISDWSSSGDTELLRGLAALSLILQDIDNLSLEEVVIPHSMVAEFSDMQAKALGLPTSIPYQLRVWGTGNWFDDSYVLNSEFVDHGQGVYLDERIGSIAVIGKFKYRVPEPMFSLIQEVQDFPQDRDGKIEVQARISELLGQGKMNSSRLDAEEQIANIRIRHVAGFSSSVSGSLDDPILKPVLFARHVVDTAAENEEILDEAQQILGGAQGNSFVSQFFSTDDAKPTYVLTSGEYVYIDPSVRPALQAYREICAASPEIRRAFIKSPNAVLASRITEAVDDPEVMINRAFVATAQFSDRVIGINKWVAPDLPWLAEESNEWGTNILIFEQPGMAAPVVIPRENLQEAVNAVQEGLKAGLSIVTVGGLDIPVSTQLLMAMQQMLPIDPDKTDSEYLPKPKSEPVPDGPFVVETIDGFEAVNYVKALKPPESQIFFAPPRALVPATKLMRHQEIGVQWLIEAYNQGLPGVLIADDMGLGKTLQALVFLALYQEQLSRSHLKPCLIVAPTGLLNNWLREIDLHLGEAGLGGVAHAYGSQLKKFKNGISGKDIDFGVPMLNTEKLQAHKVVLTTYESLRDYQVSFAQMSFGIVVFDEIQKTKNPRSLISRAAAAVNGQFQIGLSGTPVENSLADLWTIMDILTPGLLRMSLRDFMSEYAGSTDAPETIDKLKRLQQELLEHEQGRIPPILRRLKSEVFLGADMPRKIIHPATTTCAPMPPEQANAYHAQLEKVQRREIKMVQALQAFKRISLAPRRYDMWLENVEDFISVSGRLTEFFRIVDAIKARDEKVLVFLESLELQPILAQIFKERYALRKLPLIINGSVSGLSRQNSVNEFQSEDQGFNVMLISPKAGGVGLTLTAANNVVHLERWWNPAVEDQCNDRAYRIGQTKDVNIYTPISQHPVKEIPSFDLVLDGILTRKRGLAESLFVPSELSPDDFSEVFGEFSTTATNSSFSPMTLEETYMLERGEEFEDYVSLALYSAGFSVSKTKRSWDYGCDLIAKNGSENVLCQVKQVRTDKALMIGVEEIIGSKEKYISQNPTHLVLITNAKEISNSQRNLALRNNVIILSGDDVQNYGEALRKLVRP